jgi:hypothetical protein
MVSELGHAHWISHAALTNTATCPSLLTIGVVLSRFAYGRAIARRPYRNLVDAPPAPSILVNIHSGSRDDDRSLNDDACGERVADADASPAPG